MFYLIEDFNNQVKEVNLFIKDVLLLNVVYLPKILMVVQRFVGKVVSIIIGLQVLLQNAHNLLNNGDLLFQIDYRKNLIYSFLAVKCPIVKPKKDDKVHVQPMMVHLKFPYQRYLLFFQFHNNIWEIFQIWDNVEGRFKMFVLITFDCKTIVEEQSSVAIMTIPEVDLIIFLNVVKLCRLDNETLILFGKC